VHQAQSSIQFRVYATGRSIKHVNASLVDDSSTT
jgi:hypothetical protein